MNITEFINALKMKGGFETVNHTISPSQIRILGRVGKDYTPGWYLIVRQLLTQSGRDGWTIDISKQYFLRGDKVMFAWRIILQVADSKAGTVESRLLEVMTIIGSAPKPKVVIMEEPLPGVRGDRNVASAGSRGKGAQNSLSAKVGPGAKW